MSDDRTLSAGEAVHLSSIKLPEFDLAHAAAAERCYLDRSWETMPPFAGDCFSFLAESFRPLVRLNRDSHASQEIVVQHADARGLVDGLI